MSRSSADEAPSRARAGVLIAVAVAACSARGAGDVDAAKDVPAASTALCVRYETDAAAPGYATVQRIFDENCGDGCHVPGADLELTPGPAWPRLVGQRAPAAESCGGILVVPGAPGSSYLYQKLSSDAPCSGARMPRGDIRSVPLPDCVVGFIERWIAEGAPGPGGVLLRDAGADAQDAGP